VRISAPLPPVWRLRSCRDREIVNAVAAQPPSAVTRLNTLRVWLPTSVAVLDQPYQRFTMASCALRSRRSTPVAATSAIAMAIDVSSVHSPGAHPKPPPPTMATSFSGPRAGWNSYGAPSASPAAVASSTPQARSICAVVNVVMAFPL
jgi:hypothetical protein